MLTTPDDLLFFYLRGDDLQNDLFHHLSSDGSEADWPVVSWVHLLALFVDRSNTDFPPVISHHPPLLFSVIFQRVP